jgi:putative addiction module killer protein
MRIQIEEYVREDGVCPYAQWFEALDHQAATKVTVALVRLELGNTSNIKWFRGLGELKINWGPGYRVYLIQDGERLVVLLGGSTKQHQQKAIEAAIRLHQEYKTRKKRGLV